MIRFFAILLSVSLLTSCGGAGKGKYSSMPGDTLTSRSELLTIVDRGDFVTAEIADPWHDGRLLGSYALVDRNKQVPEGLDKEFTIIRVPLERSLVCSATNTSAIGELGELKRIAAVSDGSYYAPSDTISRLIALGSISDIGNSMSPAPEKIVEAEPDAILVSPYENSGHGVIESLGIPIIDFADYLETSPLARAEWMLLLGELYGQRDMARSIYNQVSSDYNSLAAEVDQKTSRRPKVICERASSGVWFVPGGKSYMAAMLRDAGACYPWSDDRSTGSIQLDVASVLDRASDADIWLMRNSPAPTLAGLQSDLALNARFKAFADGEVYNCDSSVSPIFNDIAFHPERILLDFIIIFHPELMEGLETVYYKKI